MHAFRHSWLHPSFIDFKLLRHGYLGKTGSCLLCLAFIGATIRNEEKASTRG